MFATSREAKEAKWFSRLHQTSAAHDEARQRRQAKLEAKVQNVRLRQEEADNRSPSQQLRRLDKRLGIGVGANKERARLEALIG